MTTAERLETHKERLETALKHARRVLRYSKRAKKALESVRRKDIAPASVDTFVDARAAVQKLLGKTGSAELESELSGWLDATNDDVARSSDEKRRRLLEDLQKRASDQGVGIRKLGDTPPTVALGPIQVVLEAGRDAQLKLGLEPIDRAAADSAAIFEAIQRVRDEWEDRTPSPPELFQRIRRAYLMSCARSGHKPGDRIDIVDLPGPLALLECDDANLRKTGLASLAEYPRHLLARQLSTLSRERLLEHDGYRLELGAATGGSTKDKDDVLYVQTTPSRGQYFLTIRFSQV
ncbi:MAG: hypothetical protein ACQEVA_17810 [Myxococcota bacterium]